MPVKLPGLRAVVACVALLPLFAATAGPEYRMTKLGPSKPWSWATAINNHGILVGQVGATKGVRQHGVRFVRTRAHAIDFYGKKRSYPYAVNDNGLAVGALNYSGTAAVFFGRHPERLFDQLTPQATWKSLNGASDVNNQGQIVGTGTLANGGYRGFLYQNGVATVLTGLAADSDTSAGAINEAGAVIGSSAVPGSRSARHAVIFLPGSTQDLAAPGHRSHGVDLNNRGVAVSYALLDDGRSRSYLHWDGLTADLGGLPGYRAIEAAAINENNDVVGTAHQGRKKRDHGFLYRSARLHDLNDLVVNRGRYTITRADGINDKGVIAAMAYDAKAKKSIAVRLDPVK